MFFDGVIKWCINGDGLLMAISQNSRFNGVGQVMQWGKRLTSMTLLIELNVFFFFETGTYEMRLNGCVNGFGMVSALVMIWIWFINVYHAMLVDGLLCVYQ